MSKFKRTKAVVAGLLSALMLTSALPFAASAAETTEAVAAETAETQEQAVAAESEGESVGATYSVSTASALKTALAKNEDSTITLTADISSYIGASGDHSNSSYVPVWCTVGSGKKTLLLKGHTVDMKNSYVVVYDNADKGEEYLESHSNLCLFKIPSGADLTVYGNDVGKDGGGMIYSGEILRNRDGLDQRDIFHVEGGKLTVYNGRYDTADTYESYTYGTAVHMYQTIEVGATPLTVKSGEVVINGGYFEGRCLSNQYSLKRNAALEVYAGAKVTLNGGFFYGIDCANSVWVEDDYTSFNNGNFTINAGGFGIDDYSNWFSVEKGQFSSKLYNPGQIGLCIESLDPCYNYYIADGSKVKKVFDHDSYQGKDIVNLRAEEFYIEPKTKYPRLNASELKTESATSPLRQLSFRADGTYAANSISQPYSWKVGSSQYVYVSSGVSFPQVPGNDNHYISASVNVRCYESSGSGYKYYNYFYTNPKQVTLYYDAQRGAYRFNLLSVITGSALEAMQMSTGWTYELTMNITEHCVSAYESKTWFSVSHDTGFYVKAQPAAYRVSYEKYSSSGATGTMSDSVVDANTDLTLPRATFTPAEGKRFAYWLIDGEKYYVGDKYRVTKNVTAYAIYANDAVAFDQVFIDISAPESGATPSYTMTFPEQNENYRYVSADTRFDTRYTYNGVRWKNESTGSLMSTGTTFAENTNYEATLYIKTSDEVRRFISGSTEVFINGRKASWTAIAGSDNMEISCSYSFLCKGLITNISLNVEKPWPAKKIEWKATLPSGVNYELDTSKNNSSQKIYNAMQWYDLNYNSAKQSGETFLSNHNYRVTVWLKAKSTNYSFNAEDALNITINGKKPTRVQTSDYRNTANYYLVVDCEFRCADHVPSNTITYTEPQIGAHPDFTVSDNMSKIDFYTGLGLVCPHGTGLEFIDPSLDTADNPLQLMDEDDVFEEGKTYIARVWLSTLEKDEVYFKYPGFTAKMNGVEGTNYLLNSDSCRLIYVEREYVFEKQTYDIWLGDTQVTADNLTNITGDGKAWYVPNINTLYLFDPTITGETPQKARIESYVEGLEIEGSYKMTDSASRYGLYSSKDITLSGDFTFIGDYSGILTKGDLTMRTGSVTGKSNRGMGTASGIMSNGAMNIKNGLQRVEAATVSDDYGIWASGGLTVGDKLMVVVPENNLVTDKTVAQLNGSTQTHARQVVITVDPAKGYVLGDVNCDGFININDVLAIQRHLAGINILTGYPLYAADTNGDGSVTIEDATHLQMYLAEYDVVLGNS